MDKFLPERVHTFAASVPLYTGVSRQLLSAPSASPPLSSCRTCEASARTSASAISGCGGRSVDVSKLTLESSVRMSMLTVRQASLREAAVWCWMMDMLGGFVSVSLGRVVSRVVEGGYVSDFGGRRRGVLSRR